jgi:AcrR family transcriptional regulator
VWALASARAEGMSIRALATAAGLLPSRVYQLVADADLDALAAALGELRAAGWPAPEDPDSGEDAELDGRDDIADRLSDEVSWLRQCADWLAHLDADGCPPAVNLRPSADWPGRAVVAVDLARVAAVIDRIAADVDELARARRVQDLDTAAVLADRVVDGRVECGVVMVR